MAQKNQCEDCGKKISQGANRCCRCANKAKWKNPTFHRKISEATKARWARGDFDGSHNNPEVQQKMSETAKARWARGIYDNPETRRKLSEASKARWARGDFAGVLDNPETRRKMSESAKAARARGSHDSPETRHKLSEAAKRRYQDPEQRRKYSEAIKAAHARGAYDSPETRRKKSEVRKKAWAHGVYDNVFQSPTSIEVAVSAALDIYGIEHQSQYRPDGYSKIYDEFVPPNILIEVHGDYWHGPEKEGAKEKDTEKAKWAEENGFTLVVIWEHEIKKRGAWVLVRERICPKLTTDLRT